VPVTRRERAKEGRRERIVAAAHDLMSEVGVEEMSMKQVAARAEVSLSTVYNLFDSKEAVLSRVFSESFERYRAVMDRTLSPDPLERIFQAVDISGDLYSAEPDFYRSAVWLVGRGSSLKTSLQEPRVRFWCALVENLVKAGLLSPAADPTILGAFCIVPLFATGYQAWCAGEAHIDEFRARVKLGIALILTAYATPQAEAPLADRRREFEAALRDQLGRRLG
jgi:AcrR family transcriptional regulator